MAPSTERRFTLDFMLEAVPNSSANIFATREIWSLGGMINEIMLVPLLGREKRDVSRQQSNKNPHTTSHEHSSLPQGLFFTVTGVIPLLLDNNGRGKKTKPKQALLQCSASTKQVLQKLLVHSRVLHGKKEHMYRPRAAQSRGCEQKEWKQLPAEII